MAERGGNASVKVSYSILVNNINDSGVQRNLAPR